MQLEDRSTIAEALADYAYRWDSKDAEGFAELFAEDAIMERWQAGKLIDESVITGREAIHGYALKSHAGRLGDRQSRHHFSNLVFKALSTTSATTENMVLITHKKETEAPVVVGTGVYRIDWRKTPDGWKMFKRVLYSDA